MIKIDGYVIDATISEEESYESEVTAYPVESGADITDHVRLLPAALSMEFVVSDTPIGEVAKARQGNVVPSSEAKGFLLALRASSEPFTVECALGTFTSLVFESLTFPREATTGAALMGSATLRRIEIVEVRRTTITEEDRRVGGGGKKNLGNKPGQEVDPPTWKFDPLWETPGQGKHYVDVYRNGGRWYYANSPDPVAGGGDRPLAAVEVLVLEDQYAKRGIVPIVYSDGSRSWKGYRQGGLPGDRETTITSVWTDSAIPIKEVPPAPVIEPFSRTMPSIPRRGIP